MKTPILVKLILFFACYTWVHALDPVLLKQLQEEWSADQVVRAQSLFQSIEQKKLSTDILEDKLREGLAKKADANKVLMAIERRRDLLLEAKTEKHLEDASHLKRRIHELEARANKVDQRQNKEIEAKNESKMENSVEHSERKYENRIRNVEQRMQNREERIQNDPRRIDRHRELNAP